MSRLISLQRCPLVILGLTLLMGLGPASVLARSDDAHSTTLPFVAANCQGTLACQGVTGTVADDSCNGTQACQGAQANIAGSSCNGTQACQSAYRDPANPLSVGGSIGAGSCDGTQACQGTGAVSSAEVVVSALPSIGDNSCNGSLACQVSSGQVGNNSCNGDTACAGHDGVVGDCEMNTVFVEACAEYKADGQVRRPGGKLRGDDIFNSNASGQLVYDSGARYRVGTVRWVYLYVQNDGNVADTFTFDAADAVVAVAAGFDIGFYRASGTDITGAVYDGTFITPELAPGDRYGIRARVEVTPGAPHGSEVTQLVTVASVGDSNAQDTIGFRLRRR